MRPPLFADLNPFYPVIIGFHEFPIASPKVRRLYCPSETSALRWADVDFVNGTMTVTSSQTAKHGKSERVAPILRQFRPHLEAAFDPAADRCIGRYQISTANMRTEFLRILKRAEVEPWPRFFHNLRGGIGDRPV